MPLRRCGAALVDGRPVLGGWDPVGLDSGLNGVHVMRRFRRRRTARLHRDGCCKRRPVTGLLVSPEARAEDADRPQCSTRQPANGCAARRPSRACPGANYGECRDNTSVRRLPEYPIAGSQLAFGRVATALAVVSVGAVAIGALAIGRLAIKRLALAHGAIDRLSINELEVNRPHVHERIIDHTAN